MTLSNSPIKVKHIHNSKELGHYLRYHRQKQATTIADTSHLVSLGARFISEIERGKQTAFFGKTVHYLDQLGLTLHIYPRNALNVISPYGAFTDIKAIGAVARHHRQIQKVTLETVKEISGLSLRFLSEFERGNNTQISKALTALNTYGLDVIISPRNYRLSKSDCVDL